MVTTQRQKKDILLIHAVNMGKPQVQFVRRQKPSSKGYTLFGFIYMVILEKARP